KEHRPPPSRREDRSLPRTPRAPATRLDDRSRCHAAGKRIPAHIAALLLRPRPLEMTRRVSRYSETACSGASVTALLRTMRESLRGGSMTMLQKHWPT